jgi:hypothetical protein
VERLSQSVRTRCCSSIELYGHGIPRPPAYISNVNPSPHPLRSIRRCEDIRLRGELLILMSLPLLSVALLLGPWRSPNDPRTIAPACRIADGSGALNQRSRAARARCHSGVRWKPAGSGATCLTWCGICRFSVGIRLVSRMLEISSSPEIQGPSMTPLQRGHCFSLHG